VYIEEAHSADGWQLPVNVRDNVVLDAPRTPAERTATAQACVRNLNIAIPAVVDDFHNTTERAYTGWPDRLYVVDRNGNVAYKSQPGPYGFKPAEMEATLKRLVENQATTLPEPDR
jgi:type I thyroxine 5'-deiodinase